MAIATATTIDLYAGGKLLFADVSFKLEPRERMTLSGRLARPVADAWLVQWPHLAKAGGPEFWGAVL